MSIAAWLRSLAVGLIISACSVELAPLDQSDATASGGKPAGGTGGTGGGSSVGGGGTGGSNDASQSGGSAGSTSDGGIDKNSPCWRFCETVTPLNCNAWTVEDCYADCDGGYDFWMRCLSQYTALVECASNDPIDQFKCVNGYATVQNCTTEDDAFTKCAWTFKAMCAGAPNAFPDPAPSAGGCYSTQSCNPVTQSTCGSQVCDWYSADGTSYVLQCYAQTDAFIKNLCEPCDPNTGPFCKAGLGCAADYGTTCAKYCCSDEDCGGKPGSCTPMGFSDIYFCGS